MLRFAATYLVFAWLVLEVGGLLTNILELPAPTIIQLCHPQRGDLHDSKEPPPAIC